MAHPVRIGKYENLEEIGHGGFAIVYKARDTGLDRTIALKVLYSDRTADPDSVARFRREALVAARLHHPHIFTVYDAGEADGYIYIAMEYLPGQTLRELMDAEKVLSLERALPILEQIAEALDYAHRQGVIHRDIKPGNIIMEETEQGVRVILTDFGLVKAMEESVTLTSQDLLLGSPEYMAPEQADPRRATEVGPATDLYALGIVAYRMLTGQVPFSGKVPAILNAHMNLDPPDPRAIREDLSPEMATALLKMLAKAPGDRFTSAHAFVARLRTVGQDVSAQKPDAYSPLESGLQQLLNQMGQHHPDYSAALVLQHRLTQNIAETRLYRDTDNRASERAQIIHQLNNLALSALGIPFNDLCKPAIYTTGQEPAKLLQRDTDVLKSQARKGLSRRQRWVLVMSVIVIGLFGVFALGWTIGWGPAASLFWTETPPVTLTTATTPVPTVTLTLTATLAPTATQVLTPDVRTTLLILIETEKRAVLIEDMDLIRAIFAPDATKTDAATNLSWNAIQRYTQTFTREDYLEITHANLEVTIAGDKATVTNDSCGSFMVTATRQKIEYNCPQCDRWTFHRDANGRWWITDMTYNLVSNASSHRYTFEDGTHGCWTVRYDRNKPQGGMPTLTTELAHLGQGALRFAFDLARISTHRAQTIRYNMPFAGQASAYVYAPPDAPANLEAGFFAMELDHAPFNYHEANQMVRLDPGKWTRITWNIGVTGWVQPLHLLGIEVRQTSGGTYSGYVCIDDVSIKSQ